MAISFAVIGCALCYVLVMLVDPSSVQFVRRTVLHRYGFTTFDRYLPLAGLIFLCAVVAIRYLIAAFRDADDQKYTLETPNAGEQAADTSGEPTGDPGPPWKCRHCGEENPGNFNECWKCQKLRGNDQAISVTPTPSSNDEKRPKPGTRHTDPTGRKRPFAGYDKLQPMATGVDNCMGRYFKARALINDSIRRLDGMPWVLRITCLASLCTGIALLVISIFQIGSFRVNDEALSWGQIRAAGYYPFLVISGLAMTIAGIGIWMRRGWSRWFVVLIYVFPIPIEIIYLRSHSSSNGLPWGYGIEAVVWAGFFYWYLFYKQKKAFD